MHPLAFTLVEMLVAVSLFTVVMVVLIGGYLNLMGASARARAQQEVIDSLRAAVEHIDRLARSAEIVACGDNLPPSAGFSAHQECEGGNSLALVLDRTTGEVVVFRFANNTLERTVDGVFVPLVSPRAQITNGSFTAQGATANIAPRITVAMEGRIVERPGRPIAPFALQTTIAPPLTYTLPPAFGDLTPPPEGHGVIQCVFNDVPGFLVVNAGAGSKWGNDDKWFVLPIRHKRDFFGKRIQWYMAPFLLPASSTIPAGTYEAVYVQGWDDHCNPQGHGVHDIPCPPEANTTFSNPKYKLPDEPHEQMIVGFYRCRTSRCDPMNDADIEHVWDSGMTFSQDIPAWTDYLSRASITPIATHVTLPREVDFVVFYHPGIQGDPPYRRICDFVPGKPRTPANYICPWDVGKDNRGRLPYVFAEENADPDCPREANGECRYYFNIVKSQMPYLDWPGWSDRRWDDGWLQSVVPACVALKRVGGPGTDVERIRAKPF